MKKTVMIMAFIFSLVSVVTAYDLKVSGGSDYYFYHFYSIDDNYQGSYEPWNEVNFHTVSDEVLYEICLTQSNYMNDIYSNIYINGLFSFNLYDYQTFYFSNTGWFDVIRVEPILNFDSVYDYTVTYEWEYTIINGRTIAIGKPIITTLRKDYDTDHYRDISNFDNVLHLANGSGAEFTLNNGVFGIIRETFFNDIEIEILGYYTNGNKRFYTNLKPIIYVI